MTPHSPNTAAAATLNGAARLRDWGLVHATGADAATFLHSQLTQDMQGLAVGQARLAGYCSAKGRLLASFVVWRDRDQSFWLACSADLLAPTLKRLRMFVMRAKCQLDDASERVALWGVAGADATTLAASVPPGQAAELSPWATRQSDERTLLRLSDSEGLPRLLVAQPLDTPAPGGDALALADWQWLEVRSGVARVLAATAEQFVPQMVNLELVGGVNFQKGCYPGQEVVARSQYRGSIKRRAQAFDADVALAPGQEVFHSADPGQPAGLVVLAAPRPGGGHSALVELKLAALADGSLHAGAADGPLLQRATLPYALPADAA